MVVTYALCDLAKVVLVEGGADALQTAHGCYQEALAAARQVEWASLQALCLNHLGRLAYLEQDWDELRQVCGESLRLAAPAGELERIASGLRRAAALAIGTGRPRQGVAWLAVAERMQQQIAPLRATEADLASRLLCDARGSLDETAFQGAWETGQQQPWQDVVEEALGWLAVSRV